VVYFISHQFRLSSQTKLDELEEKKKAETQNETSIKAKERDLRGEMREIDL
jgi:hypothetical protein